MTGPTEHRKCISAFWLIVGLGFVGGSARAEPAELPRMDYEKPIVCAYDEEGNEVRLQCDDATLVCLFTSDRETGRDGQLSRKTMERLAPCYSRLDDYQQALHGYTLQEAIAEAPYGWSRDARGRVFQVKFDLGRRFFLGVGYMPVWSSQAENLWSTNALKQISRTNFDFGFTSTGFYERSHHSVRHSVDIARGDIGVNPFGYQITAFQWDASAMFEDPLVRITTFIGPPARHDLYGDMGFGLKLFQFRNDPLAAPTLTEVRFAEPSLYWILVHNGDFSSYLRLRVGSAYDRLVWEDTGAHETALSMVGGLQGRFTLDRNGYHHLELELEYARPRFINNHEPALLREANVMRADGWVSYERILIAINDQPISIFTRAAITYRGDIPGQTGFVEYSGTAGLRYSFWAPALPPPDKG